MKEDYEAVVSTAQEGGTDRLIPEWSKEDFDTEKPYAWLLQMQKQNKFMFLQMMNTCLKRAQEVGVTATKFRQYWKAYLETAAPKTRVVGANMTEFPGQSASLQCGEYICNESGVMKYGHMGEEVRVISHPLLPVQRVVDVDTGQQKLRLAYCRGEKDGEPVWNTVTEPRETIASAQKIVSLSAHGLAVTSENARDVVKYLSELESLNYQDMDVKKSTSHMGWLGKSEFMPFAEDVMFEGDSEEFDILAREMNRHGDEEHWLELARAVRAGKSVPCRIALAAAFAAPLVKPLNALSFFVHLWGLQGSGKTVALMLGASVWTNPAMGHYVKSFQGTKVSYELLSAFAGNLPVFLDELQVMADRQTFDDIIYSLCEGVSKGRGAKNGGLQKQKKWQTCFVTSGEMPIVKSNSGGGAAVRTIEINYGGEPFFEDARHAAQVLQGNYGFAGKRFIDAICEDGAMDMIRKIQQAYYAELNVSLTEKQVLAASILLTADKIATLSVFHDDRALTVQDIRPYLITREEADQNLRCYRWLMGYISANPARFRSAEEQNGELWGEKVGNVTYVIRTIFDRIVENGGFSAKAFLTWAKKNGKIQADDYNGNLRLTKRRMIGGTRVACVALVMDDEDEPSGGGVWKETKDDDLPF